MLDKAPKDAGDYAASFIYGSKLATVFFTIDHAPLTVTANNNTVTYGDAPANGGVTYEGFVGSETEHVLSGSLRYTYSYEQFGNVGSTYTITPGGLTSGNYEITFVDGTLTVDPKEMVISAGDQTITYGEAISSDEYGVTGEIGGHTVTVTLTPSTANVTASGTITASGAVITADGTDVTANYSVSYVAGKLVIEPDTSKIDSLTTKYVTSANESDIQAVQAMMASAETEGADDATKAEWAAITSNCEALMEKIAEVKAENTRIENAVAGYDLTTVKSSDEAAITQLISDIEIQLATNNLTDAEITELKGLKTKCENLIAKIDGTEALIDQLAKTVSDMDAKTVKSTDKAALEQLVEDIKVLLDTENLTVEERKSLEDAKAQAEDLLDVIDAAASAAETENTEKVENVTAENVKPENKEALEGAKADLEKALEENGGNYTKEEKKAIQDDIQRIEDAIEALENVEDVTATITQLPENAEPDDEETAQKILDAKTSYENLTVHEKSLVEESTKAKLDELVAALTAYKITKGDGAKWTQGSSTGLSFTANGPYSKFVGIKIDGEEVAAKYYDAKSGSTIITLKASYLNKLDVGKHTITVLYTDGEASGTFTIQEKSVSPATGDDSNIGLWASIMCVSTLALVVLLLDSKRRKSAK